MATAQRPTSTATPAVQPAASSTASAGSSTMPPAPAPLTSHSRGASSANMDVPLSSLPLSALTPPPGTPVGHDNIFATKTTRSIGPAGPVALAATADLQAAAAGKAAGGMGPNARMVAAPAMGRPGVVALGPHAVPFMYHPGMTGGSPLHGRGFSAPAVAGQDLAGLFKQMGLAQGQHPSAMAGPNAIARAPGANAAQRTAATTKPRTLPPPPYFLTSFVITMACKLAELRNCVENALATNNVDYEYNDAKWKAKCFVYRSCGFVNFCVRMFTQSGDNGDTYLVELQRRKGCHVLFRETYDKILLSMLRSGNVAPDCAAAQRARSAGLLNAAPSASVQPGLEAPAAASDATRSVSAPAAARGPAALPHLPKSLTTDLDADPAEDEPAPMGAGYRSDDTDTASESSPVGEGVAAAEAAAIAEAFNTLGAMLSSDFDDVSSPAAQSIASLSVSRRVRGALGAKAMAALASHTVPTPGQPFAQALAGRAQPGPSSPHQQPPQHTGPVDSSVMVAQLFEALLQRLDRMYPNPLTGQVVHVASIECRTACAIAIANLCKNLHCAEAFVALRAHVRLMDAVAYVPHSAATAAFRRECLHAIHAMLAGVPSAARTANELNARARMNAISTAYQGYDSVVDHYAKAISELLENAASPNAGSTRSQ